MSSATSTVSEISSSVPSSVDSEPTSQKTSGAIGRRERGATLREMRSAGSRSSTAETTAEAEATSVKSLRHEQTVGCVRGNSRANCFVMPSD